MARGLPVRHRLARHRRPHGADPRGRDPGSLGWFYAAITEYLGFQAYDGEYKVMGLAAYGQPHRQFREALERVVPVADDGWSYHVRPEFIHHGPHTYSDRFTDHLVSLLGLPPRQGRTALEPIHEALASKRSASWRIACCAWCGTSRWRRPASGSASRAASP